jgi:hypothetical protein
MLPVDGGYVINTQVRQFSEDIPYGMLMIKAYATLTETTTPEIDSVLRWAQNIMNVNFIDERGNINQDVIDNKLPFLSQQNLKDTLSL